MRITRTFEPWVGERYWDEGLSGVRVLILGEAHYGEAGDETPEYTIETVREWGKQSRLRFFTMVQMLILGIESGETISDDQRAEFWDRVAFANFVQRFPGSEPRYRPTEAMWSEGATALTGILNEIKPHMVVALGMELEKHLPAMPVGIVSCCVAHPSGRGFRVDRWHADVKAAFERCAPQ